MCFLSLSFVVGMFWVGSASILAGGALATSSAQATTHSPERHSPEWCHKTFGEEQHDLCKYYNWAKDAAHRVRSEKDTQYSGNSFDPACPVIARISLNLITSYLSAMHAEFSGGQPPAHWKHYFDLVVADCGSPSAALTAHNAHLTVDLAQAVKDSGATWADFGAYQGVVGVIAAQSDAIIKATNDAYGVDLGVLLHGIAVNIPVHDLRRDAVVAGDQVYSAQAFRLGDRLAAAKCSGACEGCDGGSAECY